MIFAQTHVPDSLARSMFQVGQAWHAKKKDDPASLSAPDASSAVPALHQRDSGQVSRHDENSFFEVHGGELGMAVPMWQGGLWDPLGLGTAEAEARQGYLRSIPQEIEQMLEELLVVATKPLVIHRFHAARRLASEYQSPVLGCSWRLACGQRRPRRRGSSFIAWPDPQHGPPAAASCATSACR